MIYIMQFYNAFKILRDAYVLRKLSNRVASGFARFCQTHIIHIYNTHCLCNIAVLFTRGFRIVAMTIGRSIALATPCGVS